jgi:hypothetical protein
VSERPEKLTETEAKAGSKTLANRNVLLISVVAVVIIFAGLLVYFK